MINLILISVTLAVTKALILSTSQNVCDSNLNVKNWTLNSIISNEKFFSNVKFTQVNVIQVEECAQECCKSNKCNYAYFKNMTTCYFLQCLNSECQLIKNETNEENGFDDLLIEIKPIGKNFK